MRDIQNLIDGLVPPDCGVKHRYCVLKLICASRFKENPRELFQIKCVEFFKWDLNKEIEQELDLSEVWSKWIEGGYAAAFADVYTEKSSNVSAREIYNLVVTKVKN